jgi:hypothetical protein
MPALRPYGIICLRCNKPLQVGWIELAVGAQNEDLRRILVEQGWTVERIVTHGPNLSCTATKQCRVDDMILLD